MGKISDRIATMEERVRQLKTQQRRTEARQRTLLSQRERRDDTRRKILVGACMLTQIDHGAMTREALLALLDPFLTRPDDRHLFGLPGLEAGTPPKGVTATATVTNAGSAAPPALRPSRSTS